MTMVLENPNSRKPKLGLRSLRPAGNHTVELADKAGRRTKRASVLDWPRDQAPLVHIEGEPVPPEQVKPPKDAKRAQLTARFWARRVAFEVAAGFSEGEKEGIELFVLRHRLSIVAAFYRRLKRSDVVAAMTRLSA